MNEVKEPKHEPKTLSVNYQAYNQACEFAKDKLTTFEAITDWIASKVDISKVNLEALNKDVSAEFKRAYIEQNSGITNIELSFEKIAYLTELDDTQLKEMIFVFYENASDLNFKKGKASAEKIDIKNYTRFTRSQNENDKVEAVTKLIEALDEVAKHTKVYKGTIQQALGNFVLHHRGSDSLMLNLALLPRVFK